MHQPQTGTENDRGGRRQTMPLTVTDCNVTNNSITITFSDPLNLKPLGSAGYAHSALNPANYTIFDPGSVDFKTQPMQPISAGPLATGSPSADPSKKIVTIAFNAPPKEFKDGDWVNIVIRNVEGVPESSGKGPAKLEGDFIMIARQVAGGGPIGRITRDVEDAIAYPILTEEVGYPPSVTSRPGMGGGGRSSGGGGAQGLGQIATNAISAALGWKPNASDAKGFVGALTQSFTITEVEGRTQSKWNARSYTVQTDLAGGITGAQASLYTRAKVAQDNCLPLLDGLYALNPTADPEYITALRDMAKSQVVEIVKQFGVVPPSILRVNTYFKILLGDQKLKFDSEPRVESDPDKVKGTLGSIRDIYGIFFTQNQRDNPFSNSVDDETNITNFRVISDYMTGLLQSWLANGRYFLLTPSRLPAFLGTQLILISRQLGVIAETVNEVRFALDSVFIGPNERQTLLLEFDDSRDLPAMYLEDVLTEIESGVSDELPRLIKDGGRIAINNNLLPVVQTLMNMIQGAKDPQNLDALPDGYSTARVRHSLDDLSDQLTQLFTQGQQVGMDIPSRVAMLQAQE
jgi:hypothetical protein